jgi:hypothetical protein
MMNEIKISNNIYDLKSKIQQIQRELDDLGDPISNIPEMINSTNLLRSNQFLLKHDEKKNNLLSVYAQYSNSMELLLSSVFEIQLQLKDILKEQSLMISPKTKKTKTKKTKTKKTKTKKTKTKKTKTKKQN